MFNSVGKEVEERLTGMVRHLENFSYRPSDLVNDEDFPYPPGHRGMRSQV